MCRKVRVLSSLFFAAAAASTLFFSIHRFDLWIFFSSLRSWVEAMPGRSVVTPYLVEFANTTSRLEKLQMLQSELKSSCWRSGRSYWNWKLKLTAECVSFSSDDVVHFSFFFVCAQAKMKWNKKSSSSCLFFFLLFSIFSLCRCRLYFRCTYVAGSRRRESKRKFMYFLELCSRLIYPNQPRQNKRRKKKRRRSISKSQFIYSRKLTI